MPYRESANGTLKSVRTVNRPRRECGPGMGCGGGMRGMGADGPLPRAAVSALAVGARTGDRAARFAVEVVKTRGLGDAVSDAMAFQRAGQGYSQANWVAHHQAPDGSWVDSRGYDYFGNLHGGSTTTSGGGISNQDVDKFFNLLGGGVKTGVDVYGRVTGRGTPPPQPAASPGPSTGLILGILGAIAVAGIGIAVAFSAGNKRTPVRANRGRRSGYRGRKSRYFVQSRRAA